MKDTKKSTYKAIYKIVQRIPKGKVATYGQIAHLVPRCTARMVGYALHALPDELDVPWQRVINSRGTVSARSYGENHILQEEFLRLEGVEINTRGKIDLLRYRWDHSEE